MKHRPGNFEIYRLKVERARRRMTRLPDLYFS
jgi:hypothetical protein